MKDPAFGFSMKQKHKGSKMLIGVLPNFTKLTCLLHGSKKYNHCLRDLNECWKKISTLQYTQNKDYCHATELSPGVKYEIHRL